MEEKLHLYTEMLSYDREVFSGSQLALIKNYSVSRSFKNKEELDNHIFNKELKTRDGFYTIENKIVKGSQGYASVFKYNRKEIIQYLKDHDNSTAGYEGECYSDWLYFDIESQISPADMKEKVTPFLKYLTIHHINYVLYFSGNKGLHLYIPMEYLNVPEKYKSKANVVCKIFARMIMKQFPNMNEIVDTQVYGINTVLRMPFSTNPKSGLLKSILTWDEACAFTKIPVTEDLIKDISKAMWDRQPGLMDVSEPHWILDESYLKIPIKVTTNYKSDTKFPAPFGEKVCIYKLLETHLSKGEHRHDAALRIMGWYHKDKQFNEDFTWAFLKNWNLTLQDPLKDNELKHIFKSIATINYNICSDPFMEQYCCKNNVCQFWREKVDGVKGVNVEQALKLWDKDKTDGGILIDFNRMYPGMRLVMKPSRGQTLVVIGGSKAGKTLFAINTALKSKINTAIFSYEISALGILLALGKMLGLNPDDPIDRPAFLAQTSHIYIVDKGLVAVQQMSDEVKIIERRNNIKIHIVIGDYMGIIPVFNMNYPGRYIDDEMKRISTMASLLPEIVKANKWLFIMPAQPTKGVEQDGTAMLLPASAKGGQAALALADAVITLWRPYKLSDPFVYSEKDKIISLWVCANRWDQEDIVRNYNYIGNKRLIQGIYEGDVVQKKAVDTSNTQRR